MWLRELLESIGYNPPPVRFLEDNMSTIHLIKNDRSESDASRHQAGHPTALSYRGHGRRPAD